MDLLVSLSSQPGWGTHDVAVERLTIEDADHERLLGQMVSACIGATEGAEAVLEFRQSVASPLEGTLSFDRLVEVSWYQPVDVATTLEFDRSVNERYTEYCATLGAFYGGTFTCPQLGDAYIAELHTYDFDDPAEAEALGDEDSYPEDFAAIITECRDLQRREEPRYILSLVPRTAG